MIKSNKIRITMVALNDNELSDDDFGKELDANAEDIRTYIGEIHGPNAIKIMGDEIVRCLTKVDRSADGYSALRLTCLVPDGIRHSELVDMVSSYWRSLPLGSNEIYVH